MQFIKNQVYFVKQIIQVKFHSTEIILYIPWHLRNLFAVTTDCLASQVALVVKYLPAKAGDERVAGLIPGWGIYSGEANGNSPQQTFFYYLPVTMHHQLVCAFLNCSPWRKNCQPTPVFLPGNSHGQRGACWATAHGVAKSQKQLSH